MASKTIESSLIIKHLASCNKKTRDIAIHLLKTWLPTHPQITNEEMKKIWKGLFYSLWHSDKSQVQLELINLLAEIIASLDISLSVHYFGVFLLTIRREWSGIDYLRLDKFYCLIRRFLSNLFVLMKNNKWGVEIVSRFMVILEEKTFLCSDKFPAQGVNYQLVGVFLDELKPFLPVKGEVIEVLLKPFVTVLGRSLDKILLTKIKGCVFGVLLDNGEKLLERKRKGEEGVEGGVDEVELFGSIALTLGFSKKFFELGSSEECVQGNRKVLFGLHEEFGKLEKDLASSGLEITIPEVRKEEVSELVPVTQVGVGMDEVLEQLVEVAEKVSNGSSKLSKKLKKASGGSVTKKSKKSKKKRDMASSSDESEVKDGGEHGNMSNGENLTDDGGLITLSAAVFSNLQMQFEKVAAEVGMDTDDSFTFDLPETPHVTTVAKKRKRAKSIGGQVSVGDDLIGQDVNGGSAFGKTGEKSGKKVKFAMKNNLVWKPQSPLPPQSLRLPPSATPRGSALKKGVPADPVIETPTMLKKVKRRASSLKKARKGLKSVSPSVKRLRKRPALSA